MSAFVLCSSSPGDLLLLGNDSATGIQEETREAVMATRKKATGKTKAKRKKAAAKAPTRRKTTTVRKTRTISKQATKKAPLRGASPKKARPTVKPIPVRPAPTPPAEPAASEERIGVVTHYYSHLSVAAIQLERGTLRVGDLIHICGHTTDFRQRVESLEVDHAPTTEVGPKDDFGLKVVDHAREHDVVFKVRS
jgi:hypothetical protein